jgi:hypothetical protein
MSFSYNDELLTDPDRVRFQLDDTVYESGPRPQGRNFSDEEISALVDAEGNWQRAVAAGFEALASAWQRFPSFATDALRLDRTAIADGYREQAAKWRKQYGRRGGVGSAAVIRVDAYSDDLDSVETS